MTIFVAAGVASGLLVHFTHGLQGDNLQTNSFQHLPPD